MTITSRHLRKPLAAAVGATTLAALVGFSGAAHAAPVAPTYFPANVGLNSSAYTLQFSGGNREGTAAGIALDAAQSGSSSGGYPFQAAAPNANPTTPATLYGPKSCPTTIVLTADDTPADALSAAGLYGVAALAVTDTAGTATTFNTKTAALLLTQSGRENATQLDTITNAAIAKIKAACSSTTINGIVLGGVVAVPDSVVAEFKSLVKDVARIAGSTRQDTARAVAVAVASSNGTGLPTVHYFPSASSPSAATSGGTSLAKTVFLAEDQTGADALSVGAVASRIGVPILLTDSGSLPQATANALGALTPKNIVVLGGTGAISDAVVSSAQSAAGTGVAATRIAGNTRYGTSVAIAEQLFNLWPDYGTPLGAAAYSDQLFGVARDEGTAAGGNHTGWPDALASAYYLASLGNGSTTAPSRVAPTVEKSRPNDGQGTATPILLNPSSCGASGTKCYPFVPLLLTPGSALAPEVATYLGALYPSSGSYKNGAAPAGKNDGGFAFIFGGTASVTPATSASVGSGLTGGTYDAAALADDVTPSLKLDSVFYTTENLMNFTSGSSSGGTSSTFVGADAASTKAKACVLPGGSTGVAGTEAVDELGGYTATDQVDYYATAAAYPLGQSLGSCVDLTSAAPATKNNTASFYGVSLSGNITTPVALDYSAAKTLSGTSPGSPSATTDAPPGGIFAARSTSAATTESIDYKSLSLNALTYKGTAMSGATAELVINLTRAPGRNTLDVISWTGTLTVTNGSTTVFTAPITSGEVDATPAPTGAITSPINLFGLYSAPGLGAITLTLIPPPPIPGSTTAAAQVSFSGNA